MKKTLFAMAALALCGTAVAGTYNVSGYEGSGFYAFEPYEYGEAVVLNVDQTVDVSTFDVAEVGSLTLNFNGASEILASALLNMDLTSSAPLSITGDPDAHNYWVSALTSATGELKSVTLASTTGEFESFGYAPIFEGASVEDFGDEPVSVTLGGTAVDYVGYFVIPSSMSGLLDSLIGDNEIALVSYGDQSDGSGQLALVGKITGSPATPEPATATLSLMALAGLCARRRRK